MSYHVESLCDCRKFGSAARKQIAMYLANKASDDGSGIWCSKHTMARHTELSLATVKRTIREFLAEGILVETGEQRPCDHGHTVVYRMVLEVVASLGLLGPGRPARPTGVTVNPVQPAPPRGVRVTPRPGSPRPPNHPGNHPGNPPTRASAREEEAEKLDMLWEVYPEDRRRDRVTTLRRAAEALAEASAEELLAAVKRYAAESASFTRSKVSFSDNWFRDGKWRRHVDEMRRQTDQDAEKLASHYAQLAAWVTSRHPLCRHVSEKQAGELIRLGLVTDDQLHAAGVRP
ncbi:hypothetical protein [Paracoccus sp. (in: a-proteobacteria)]|uniref:hypothetical protein n=1 Tax=Paracoccus sp. TaxID=267 RepID=UPI0026DEA82B|nr:hypothetical protein [Paracoccus sp. (in: a-proteobacteria)]MDO5648121.1 hypothetical protein [Paracoccus sp. (in: a-proteobacteria)]